MSTRRNPRKDKQRWERRVSALYSLLAEVYGADRLVLKAGKMAALADMRSKSLARRVWALQKLAYENPTLEGPPSLEEVPAVISDVEDRIADIMAARAVQEDLERKISERMERRQEEYLRELKMQILKEQGGPETPETLARLARLEKMKNLALTKSARELLRPQSLAEVVGQDRAIRAVMAKLATPYPQHMLLYGPPGVGKTTVARLVLEEAKKVPASPFQQNAPFVEVDGSTLRWDPREVANPLLGSVHDPIYQGARRDLAEGGIPEPKMGLVSEAHGGVLFIDEIGEMDPLLQTKLLKVLEDKRVFFSSSYYDPRDSRVPQYVRELFEEGAPADFVLIGATTKQPEELSPALRSRCSEVFFDPLQPAHIERIISHAASKLGVDLEPNVPRLISACTAEARKAIGVLIDSYGLAIQADGGRPRLITADLVQEAIAMNRLLPREATRASYRAEVGRAFGLGVRGYHGSLVEVEAVAFPTNQPNKGSVRFNEAAGRMARDSVFNAVSVVRALTGQDLRHWDIHVNVVGGGLVDGPSAGLAVLVAIYSAVTGRPVRGDVALTGEVSIQGRVKAVGGLHEKLYGAQLAGIQEVVLPWDNRAAVASWPGMRLVFVKSAAEALEGVLAG